MLNWFFKKEAAQKHNLVKNVDEHPDTRLVKVLQINPTDNVQILELQGTFYLLEKHKSQKQEIHRVEDRQLLTAIKRKRISTQQVSDYLTRMGSNSAVAAPPPVKREPKALVPKETKKPVARAVQPSPPPVQSKPRIDFTIDDSSPYDPFDTDQEPPRPATRQQPTPPSLPAPQGLKSRLSAAMAEFAQNNPDVAESLQVEPETNERPFQEYFKALVPAPVLATPSTFSAHARMATRQPVTASLDSVIQKQKVRLQEVQHQQRQVEYEKNRVAMLLDRKKYIDAKIIQVEQMLGKVEMDAARQQFTEMGLLQKTADELSQMQKELTQILTDGSVLIHLLENEASYAPYVSGPTHPLESLVRSIQFVTRQRRLINDFLHQQENALLEQQRVEILLRRKREVELAIQELKQVVHQIEQANQTILAMDPLAVTEPVPAVALHELKRLEYELKTILGDPGIQDYMRRHPFYLNSSQET